VKQTDFKPVSQRCWDLKFSLDLDRVRCSVFDIFVHFYTTTTHDKDISVAVRLLLWYRLEECFTLIARLLFHTTIHTIDVVVELLKFYVTCVSLLQSRELAITIIWKDQRQMCALKFLRLEDFLYDRRHGQAINLEPQGILFADVCNSFKINNNNHSNNCSISVIMPTAFLWSA